MHFKNDGEQVGICQVKTDMAKSMVKKGEINTRKEMKKKTVLMKTFHHEFLLVGIKKKIKNIKKT